MSKVVTFVGGPLDLTRAAVDTLSSWYRSPQVRWGPLASIGAVTEFNPKDPLPVYFYEAIYRLQVTVDARGNEVYVYVWFEDTDQKSFNEQVVRLRKELEQAQIDRDGLKKKLDDALGRLSSIGNVLSAKDPGPQIVSPRPMLSGYSRDGDPTHAQNEYCALARCRPA